MISQYGFIVLICLCIIISLFLIKSNNLSKKLKYTSLSVLIILLIPQLILCYSFIVSDFKYLIVNQNSSLLLPLLYKFSASWSNHEGSMLLWVSSITLVTLIFHLKFLSSYSLKILNHTLAIQFIIIGIFILYIAVTCDPFVKSNFNNKAVDGLGLNPSLQHPALSIHPPLLYLGYVSYSIPFSLCIASLLNKDFNQKILITLKFFSLFAWSILSVGIILGSYWAYNTLGWGGYWFFDPVENISLMPWLSGIVFHHYLVMYARYNTYLKGTIIFGITTFLLCLLNTFFVRSGILTSVHSFALDYTRAVSLLIIFVIFTSFSLIVYLANIRYIDDHQNATKLNTTIFAKSFYIGHLCLIVSIVLILLSTIYPLILNFYFNKKVIFEQNFYLSSFIPLLLPSIILANLACVDELKTSGIRNLFLINKFKIITSITIGLFYFKFTSSMLGSICVIIGLTSICSSITQLYDYYILNKKCPTIKYTSLSMILAHLGISLILINLTIYANLSSEHEFKIDIGQIIQTKFARFKLKNIHYYQGQNFYSQYAKLAVLDKSDNEVTELTPELKYYIIEQQITAIPSTYSSIFYDYQAIISNMQDNIPFIKIYYRPASALFLFSCFIMICGSIIGLFSKKRY